MVISCIFLDRCEMQGEILWRLYQNVMQVSCFVEYLNLNFQFNSVFYLNLRLQYNTDGQHFPTSYEIRS